MPELPEVEITTRNLNKIIDPPTKIREWLFFRNDLRNKIPVKKIKAISDKTLNRIYRRAKFIIFEFKTYSIVSHLGMTGNWRVEKPDWERKAHDHIALALNAKTTLVYNDPRRFGEFDLYQNSEVEKRFHNFGPEPLVDEIDWKQITKKFKTLNTSVKVALMNQKHLVGVGNIYASEALFRSKIKPQRLAKKVTEAEYEKLWVEVIKVLKESIQAGGSSISDFKNGYGEKGDFQNRFLVYDRKGNPCVVCQEPIQSLVLGGRSTFWCKNCQK